ncbi:MAG: ABC transporter substrate-binding protein [Acidimicrobiales bacterium]
MPILGTRHRLHRLRLLAGLVVVALLLAACSGGSGSKASGKRASGPPIVVGLINQENAAIGSFPEVRTDAEAAVRYVNAELDGIGGHPVRLETCTTDGTPESSQACANRLRQKNPVAVLGGIDLGAADSLPVLNSAHIPYVGASPSLGDELTDSNAFMLTAGAAGDLLGQAAYLTDMLHAKRVTVLYINLPGLLSTAVEAAKSVLSKKGVTDVKLVAEKADTPDFTPALNSIKRDNPDAIVSVFPAQGCARIMQAAKALGVGAKLLFPGACAARSVIDASGGGADGAYFASAFLPYDGNDPDVATYLAKRKAYGATDPPSVLAQAGFGEVLDLRQVLAEVQGPITPDALIAKLRTTKDQPGFMSHAFTCDHQQVLLLGAVCNANVRLLQYSGGRFNDVVGNWVSGADLIRLAIG